MQDITIREDFRRDGLCMTFLADETIMHNLAGAFPRAILNIGYPAICSREEEMCRRITDSLSKLEIETATVGHAIPTHLEKMASIANRQVNTSANFWIPFSDYMIKQTVKKPIKELLVHTKNMVDYWRTLSVRPLDVALVDTTRNEDLSQRLKLFYNELKEKGVRSVIICDTTGTVTPKRLSDLLIQFQGTEADIEYHPHNDNGLALDNIETAISLGTKRIGTAAFGFGERGTMVDPRELVAKYSLLYNPENFNKFKRKYNDLVRGLQEKEEIFTKNAVITGTQYRLRGRNSRSIPKFGVTSDKYILAKLTGRFPEEISDEFLSFVKNSLYDNRKRTYNSSELKQKRKDFENDIK